MTGAAHRAALAVNGLIHSMGLEIAVSCLSLLITDISHRLPDRAGVSICLGIIDQVISVKGVRLLVIDLFIEVVVFNERYDPFLFQISVVLFAPVSGIGRQALRRVSKARDMLVDVAPESICVGCCLLECVVDDVLPVVEACTL